MSMYLSTCIMGQVLIWAPFSNNGIKTITNVIFGVILENGVEITLLNATCEVPDF